MPLSVLQRKRVLFDKACRACSMLLGRAVQMRYDIVIILIISGCGADNTAADDLMGMISAKAWRLAKALRSESACEGPTRSQGTT